MPQNAQKQIDVPKKHPRNTPTPSMEALGLIDALEAVMLNLPIIADGVYLFSVNRGTPSLVSWFEMKDVEFPQLKATLIASLSQSLNNSVDVVIQLLEAGVPPHVALGFLPSELASMLELQASCLRSGCTD